MFFFLLYNLMMLMIMMNYNFMFYIFMIFSSVYFYSMITMNMMNNFYFSYFIVDNISFFMIYMMMFIMFISNMINKSSFFKQMNFYLLFLSCFMVFFSNHYFMIFLNFEISIIPISMIILKWGTYPERSKGVMFLFLFTLMFSLPYFNILFYFFLKMGSWYLLLYENYNLISLNFIMTMMSFFIFSVKLPLLGLHFWLPIAHVEAPTFGSMILAGVLLKLGGVGLMRIKSLMNMNYLNHIYVFLMMFFIYSTLLCFFQMDFKKLIAYSSIFHMSMIPIMLMNKNCLSDKIMIMGMVFHGLISPMMFLLVGNIYELTETRQLMMLKNFFWNYPLLTFFGTFCFLSTLPVPPFLSFFTEVYMVMMMMFMYKWNFIILSLSIFFSLIFNFKWYLIFFNIMKKNQMMMLSLKNYFLFTITFMYFSFLMLFMHFL